MRFIILTLTAALCLALVSSHPLPEDGLRSEALDRLVMAEADSEAALRSKRTIGILRQIFPEISQRIEEKVNSIIAEVIRALGPIVLRNLLGNNNPPGVERTNTGTSVAGESPFGDDNEDEDEDEDDNETSSVGSNGSRILIDLPTFPPDEEKTSSSSSSSSITTTTDTVESRNDVGAATTTTVPSPSDNEVTTSL